jgi:large subunit ribosomal protein L21
MNAIVEFQGKQYKVAQGVVIRTLQVEGEPGSSLEGGRVLVAFSEGSFKLGKPAIEGAKVTFEVLRHAKAPKIRIWKYKSKNNWSRRMGYREKISYLRVTGVEV